MNLLNRFRTDKGFGHGGIHPLAHKASTAATPIRRLAFAPRLVVPLSQHRGRPARPVVAVGQEVVRGEPIAIADGYLSVPMHAPATGRVQAIELWPTAAGPREPAIVIDVYRASGQAVLFDQPLDVERLSRGEIAQAVQDAGLVGLGGAAFPTHVKMRAPGNGSLHTLLVNGCECEPYLTCDHRVMLEQTEALLRGIRIMLRATGAVHAMIGVEDDKMDALGVLGDHLRDDDPISLHPVQARYPQGAERMLIEALLDREVPEGGLPSDLGVVVYNVGTLAQVGELLPRGQGLIERVITVSGPGVDAPGNYLVPLGTPVSFVLEQARVRDDANEVILGGPMMGMTVASLDVPITKGVSGVVVYCRDDADQRPRKVFPCIKCSRCVDACPMHLNPSMLGQLARKRDYATMARDFHLDQCFECGCCAYVCPSNIPLTQYFRIAKSINRERAAAGARP